MKSFCHLQFIQSGQEEKHTQEKQSLKFMGNDVCFFSQMKLQMKCMRSPGGNDCKSF